MSRMCRSASSSSHVFLYGPSSSLHGCAVEEHVRGGGGVERRFAPQLLYCFTTICSSNLEGLGAWLLAGGGGVELKS
jgi:hypothetical protein